MGMTSDDYLAQQQALLPRGKAWPRSRDARMTKILQANADGFARVDRRVDDLIEEADPRTTSELLSDWEEVAGLPDPCVVASGATQTKEQRRAALVAKLTAQGGQSRQFFIDLAAALGFPGATVDEYRPFKCNSKCDDALWTEDDRFAWKINLPSTGGVFTMNCNSPCDSPLVAWGDSTVECRIQRLKPGHTTALVAYV